MKRHTITARGIRALAATAALGLALTGCSAIGQQAPSSTDSTGASNGTVTILTHDSFNISEEQIAAFEAASGYTLVTTAPGDAGFVVNQLILSKDAPTVDGVYGIDNYSAQAVIDAGALAPYGSPALPESAKTYSVGSELTPIDMGQVCINIDHEWFAANGVAEPTTLDQLAEPEYAKLLVVTDPATSSPGLAFLVATIAAKGEDGWQDYWKALLAGGTKVAAGWSDAYYTDFSGADGKGAYPLVLSYSSSPAYTGGATGSIEATCTTQVEYAGVVAGAKNPEGAQAFIDYLLSNEFQAGLPDNMYMYPVDDRVSLPTEWSEFAALSANPLDLDAATVAANRTAWISEWTTLNESR
ncbi:thiamine ABC transporter substrate-binding protein [Gulosibacter macacae]|uniref:Thiamine ABC transporter substrate-binding protein n=1 Tax=Gulosibacter macacae TaxID=2488791 RepID=A0A3P3VYW4_9MICO|nr:thiamine ABC transporter substrate-binding protein [Gulosibacter macacae]RRJ85863.1 thiamine ABC transporter substrate-binding protein [Gulosibacter macacae]